MSCAADRLVNSKYYSSMHLLVALCLTDRDDVQNVGSVILNDVCKTILWAVWLCFD